MTRVPHQVERLYGDMEDPRVQRALAGMEARAGSVSGPGPGPAAGGASSSGPAPTWPPNQTVDVFRDFKAEVIII